MALTAMMGELRAGGTARAGLSRLLMPSTEEEEEEALARRGMIQVEWE